jgi:HPt (histidine-containing phosphotransfer) domain-containing protein
MPNVAGSGETTGAAALAERSNRAFDLAALLRRCMDDNELAAGLVEKFTSRLSSVVHDIESLLAAGDCSQAASKVHRLKGEAGSLAAVELQAAASLLEECLRGGCLSEAPVHLRKLKSAADECLQAHSWVLARLG